ncbi:hypothetical protein KP509_27G053200 [Ceratopteris richardii]|uniref:Pentatricopeptide repeat-containing protein n=1 Tax=Ceratopteris richardii TaxID=49495 RepID=A0A8T2RIW1_CERRI|nr:hypothetical protein KP509_27G053200 [Ceratopteris richardii]
MLKQWLRLADFDFCPEQFGGACWIVCRVTLGSTLHQPIFFNLQEEHYSKDQWRISHGCTKFSSGDVGCLHDAQRTFNKLPYPDDSSWNALIKAYARCGEERYAFYIYRTIFGHSMVKVSSSTFVALAKACVELNDIELCNILYSDIMRKGLLDTDIFLGTAIVDMYAKCGSLAMAQEVFDSLPEKDVVSWTTLITGCVQQDISDDALYYFEKMQQQGIPPDDITFACCLQACNIVGDIEKGQAVHMDIVQKGMERDVFIGNVLIDLYSCCGLIEDAEEIFNKLPGYDVVSWNTLIAGYVENCMYKEALSKFLIMKEQGLCPEAVTLVSVLKACGGIGDINNGQHIQSDVVKHNLEKNAFIASALVDMYIRCGFLEKAQEVLLSSPIQDIVGWTALITGYTENGEFEKTFNAFETIHRKGILPVTATYGSILRVCTSLVTLDKGLEIHAEVTSRGLEDDFIVSGTLLGMYSRCACLFESQQMFEKLPVKDAVSWTTLIAGYAFLGDIERAFSVVDQMLVEGFEPNSAIYGQILNAYNHRGLVDEGQMFFIGIIRVLGIVPTSEHYTCLIDLFSRAGQIDTAALVLKHMVCHPSCIAWHVILGACQKWNNVEVGKEAFKNAVLLDEYDHIPYVAISNIYADAIFEDDLHFLEVQYM